MSAKVRIRASAVCVNEERLLLVRLRDPSTGEEGLYPPGGGVEPGEEPWQTAARETREETGLEVTIDRASEYVDHYPFRWNDVDYAVTTHYFAAHLVGPGDLPEVVDADYNLGASWRPVDEALSAMALHPRIAAAVAEVLRRMRV